MERRKMSLANIQGKLSRAEMKKIMAGSGSGCATSLSWCDTANTCTMSDGTQGSCYQNSGGTKCYCGSITG
jgi:ABC-type uncharacterized transport system YnjBCD ATPase subunit